MLVPSVSQRVAQAYNMAYIRVAAFIYGRSQIYTTKMHSMAVRFEQIGLRRVRAIVVILDGNKLFVQRLVINHGVRQNERLD